jgi:hypothetical protein
MKTVTNTTGRRHKGWSDNGVPAFDFSHTLCGIPTASQVRPTKEKRKIQGDAVSSIPARETLKKSSLKNLAEAMILQSIEDLWSRSYQKESIEFFRGDGFRRCADMAGLSVVDRLRIIRMLRKIDTAAFRPRHSRKLSGMRGSL